MSIPLLIFISIEIILVSLIDLKERKISNWWSILNIGVFFVLLYLFPSLYHFSWKTFIFPSVFFVAGFILFLMRIMGGGDSKYLSSIFLIVIDIKGSV